jgi:murein DD-endopeptidase MepM/ murein hydrolase activator NlpD
MINSARVRVGLFCLVALSSITTAVWFLQKRSGYYKSTNTQGVSVGKTIERVAISPQLKTPAPDATTTPAPSEAVNPPADPFEANRASGNPATLDPSFVGKLNLIIPVVGVRVDQLRDTFSDARSEGRTHDAIDIPAPAGTPVLAAGNGEIIKLFQSERGGMTIYQLSEDKKLIFYYAHLQRYADGLSEGRVVRQGETIAYVGDTGNAAAGNYHLHFSIAITEDPKRYWEGTNINPFPLLRRQQAENSR